MDAGKQNNWLIIILGETLSTGRNFVGCDSARPVLYHDQVYLQIKFPLPDTLRCFVYILQPCMKVAYSTRFIFNWHIWSGNIIKLIVE